MSNNPKIVPGTEVEFNERTPPKADTLDTRVQSQAAPSWKRENMQYLAERVWPAFINFPLYRYQDPNMNEVKIELSLPTAFTTLISYLLSLRKWRGNDKHQSYALISVGGKAGGGALEPTLIASLMEQEFGPEVCRTGIFEALKIDRAKTIRFSELERYVHEVRPLASMDGLIIEIPNNPYLTLLTLPVSGRAFFTGVLSAMNPPVYNDQRPKKSGFVPLAIGLREIMAYAKTVDEVANVKKYTEILP